MHVLVIEDQDDVSDVVRRALESDGHRVSIAKSIADADACVSRDQIEVAVLDLGLPDGHGLNWCKRMRALGRTFPILVLSAQSAVAVRVATLDAGAEDYLAKPFAVPELRARIRALGRRPPLKAHNPERAFGEVRIQFSARRAWLRDVEVMLTAREWRIVELLGSRGGNVVSRAEIIGTIWGEVTQSAESSLEVIVGRIRKKLGQGFIRTVRSEGYALR